MDNTDRQVRIKQCIDELCRYSQLQVYAASDYRQKVLRERIDEISGELTELILMDNQQTLLSTQQQPGEMILSKAELANYDGSGRNPAYVAVNGIVYDMSKAIQWGGGTHFGLFAGKDLSADFTKCHSENADILKKFPVVGKLSQE